MTHQPGSNRYETMTYRLCGRSGLKLPLISLGLWQNFGSDRPFETQQAIVQHAFDLGITHFDLANNYGPPTGESERTFGKILRDGLMAHRAELIISTKAGYRSRPGPYGDGGSRKNIITSCDESLKNTGLDYFDIFYHHRMDTEVPVDETMAALDQLVRQGKALYIGVSSHTGERVAEANEAIRADGLTRLTSLMSRYNLMLRTDEIDKWPVAAELGIGGVAFSPLAEGLLTDKYLAEAPPVGSRYHDRLTSETPDSALMTNLRRARALSGIAKERGQTLAQMSLAWLLTRPVIASTLIGASSIAQLDENVAAIGQLDFSDDQLARIDAISKPNQV